MMVVVNIVVLITTQMSFLVAPNYPTKKDLVLLHQSIFEEGVML
jgi:hypothetical protein